jgi:hypothetical protein
MKANNNFMTGSLRWVMTCLLLFGLSNFVGAQSGPSFSISTDMLPYQNFDETVQVIDGIDTTNYDDAQVQIKRYKASVSYPIVFGEGRTIMVNDLSYMYREFSYRNFIDYPLEALHSADYMLMLQRRLSLQWSVWTIGTISMASDLESDVSDKDFGFQAAVIFIRHYSERFSLGAGVAYSAQFGEAQVVPILAFDWNNGSNLMARAILPVSLEFWYRPGQRVDLGFIVSGDGNNFHGDPDTYLVDNPRLRYTMLTIAPAVKLTLSSWLKLNIEGGLVGLHRFEFYDDDNEVGSFDMEPDYYVRTGLEIGG